MAASRSWASFPRRNTDTSTDDEEQSLENLTQPTKPEPQETLRRLTSRETLFMSPSKTWNLYRRNPWYLSWQQETWAMIFSLSCLVAVAVIMAWIDGKRLSIWHWAIQPNAVISVLIVSSKAALMISTASCVSQLEWTHFQKRPRQLRDLEGFDDASRGAWGSLQLLFSPSGYLNVAVTLGCSITVLVLAMETFGQQLLSFPERRIPVTNETASFPVIQNFNPMPSLGYWSTAFRSSFEVSARAYGEYLRTDDRPTIRLPCFFMLMGQPCYMGRDQRQGKRDERSTDWRRERKSEVSQIVKAGEPSIRIIRIAIHDFRDPDITTAIEIVDDDDDDV